MSVRKNVQILMEEAFLLEAATPGGAAHAGFRPAYVNRMVVAGLIRAVGSTHEPYFPGSRGFKSRQLYEATELGKREAAIIRQKREASRC